MNTLSPSSIIEQKINPDNFKPKPIDDAAYAIAMQAFHWLDYGAQTGEWNAFMRFTCSLRPLAFLM